MIKWITAVLLVLCLVYNLNAQIFPNPATLSTGQGPVGTNDPIWQVSPLTPGVPPNPMSGINFVPAYIDNNCAPGSWVDPASLPPPVNNGNWITSPGQSCANNLADGYLYYRLTLNLPPDCAGRSVSTPGVYSLSFDGYVDNTIVDVFVNGVSTGISGGSFSPGTQISFTLTGPWVGGTNYIDVLVRNVPGGNPNPYGLLLVASTTLSASTDADNDGVADLYDNCMCDPGNGPDGCPQAPHPNNCDLIAIRQAFFAAGCVELETCLSNCSMYFYNPQSLSGSAAQAFAQSLGANLISIQSAAENACIINALNTKGYGGIIWIGFNDEASEGLFEWYDQSPVTYTNWAPGEPNNLGGNEDCTQIYPNGQWNDLPCNVGNSASVIEVNLCPQVTIAHTPLVCKGNGATLTASTILGSAPYSYTWSTPGNGNVLNVLPQTNSSYAVTATDRYQCTASASATVDVYQVNVSAGPDKAYCIGGSAQLEGSGTVRFEWSPTSDLSDPTVANPVASPTTTTSYVITGYDVIGNIVVNGDFNSGNTGFSSQYTYSTNLNPEGRYWVGPNANNVHNGFAPITDHTTGNGNYMVVNGAGTPNLNVWCQTISVEPNTDYNFSAWITSVSAGSPAILQFSINGQMLNQPFNAPATVGQWIEFFAVWNSGNNNTAQICIVNQNTTLGGNDFGIDDISFRQICRGSDTVTVTVYPLPVADAGNNTAVCFGDTASLQATGGVFYLWSPAIRLSCIACDRPFAAPLITTTYRVSVTDSNQCVNYDSVTVIVNPLPVVGFNGLSPQYCLLDTAVLLTGNPVGGIFSGTGMAGNVFSPTTAGTGTHTIRYDYTDNNGCSNAATLQTTVHPMPQISFTGIDTTHCADADPSPVHPQPAGGILTGTAINNNLFFPQTAGTGYHWIYYDYTDNNGCNTSDSLLMRVDELPVVILSATHITCHGYDDGIAVANVSNGTFPYQYYWNTSNRDSVIRNLPPGNYSVTITDANGCTTTGNITVTEPMKITLDIIAAPDSVMLGDTVQFFISHNAGTIQSYVWQPADWLSCTSCPQPFSVPQETITYTLTITDTNTCTASDTAFIFIKPKKAFYIPNIFSPNNDGINDILYVYIKGTKRFTFRIYNRWGEKVFETTDPLIGWNGNYKNKEAEPGVYVYDLHAIYWDNEPIKKKGSITLVR
jgi:gliding motility-associated-like protein